jgi:virginiamycin B lyase
MLKKQLSILVSAAAVIALMYLLGACGAAQAEPLAEVAPAAAVSAPVAAFTPEPIEPPPTVAAAITSVPTQASVDQRPAGPSADARAAATPLATAPAAVSPSPTMPDVPVELTYELVQYPVPEGSRPHDVAPAPDGRVWYTAQGLGELGVLDSVTGSTRHIPLGAGSAPHGVILGPDGAPWVTDSGLNAIVRVDPLTDEIRIFPLPDSVGYANLNTAAFDATGRIWFTGQSGVYGVLDPASGELSVFNAPRGRGPYGIAATPSGDIYFASLAGSYVGHIDLVTGAATILEPPTPSQGARRVWSDSAGRIWVSQWNTGQVAVFDPANERWREWALPGPNPRAYAVYVDELDAVWLSDFSANAIVRFDPATGKFLSFPLPANPGDIRQILGRLGEIWGPESAADALVVIRFWSTGG